MKILYRLKTGMVFCYTLDIFPYNISGD